MKKITGFTVTELIITMAIGSILAVIGISGYLESLRVERRKDAIFSLRKASLDINSAIARGGTRINCNGSSFYDATNLNCTSDGGFYRINYNPTGFVVDRQITNNLIEGEIVYLSATAIPDRAQAADTVICQTIFLTTQNNLHPRECID